MAAILPPVPPARIPPPPVDETPFWTDRDQMGLSDAERRALSNEGLEVIADFADFREDQLKQAFKNIRTATNPIPGVAEVLDTDGTVLYPAIPPIPAIPGVRLPAKCMLRLQVATTAFEYYFSIQRPVTVSNMHYTRVLKEFQIEWEAVCKLSKEDKPEVPKLSKHVTPIRWVESFKDCAFRTFGVRGAPLSYVIRESDIVPTDQSDPLLAGKSYGSSGSVMQEMINRLDHVNPLFKTDNAMIYSMLEIATRTSVYANTIKPFSRTKDGRKAWKAMVASHVGDDKWENLQREKLRFLMNTIWNGRSYSLEKFLGQHRSAFVQLEEAAMHVNIQLPTSHTRVGYLLDNIQNNDPDLRAALSNIRINVDNMRDNFEKACAFLLPVCPYTKNRISKSNNKIPNVSSTSLKNSSESTTGVDFRWHTHKEYSKLSPAQKDELKEWQNSKEGKAQIDKYHAAKNKRNAAKRNGNLTRKQLQAKINALQAEMNDKASPNSISADDMAACISTVMQKTGTTISDNSSSGSNRNSDTTPTTKSVSFIDQDQSQTYKIASQAIQKILKRKRGECE